jgi:acetyl esterase
LAVSGDSACGALAAAVSWRRRDRGEPLPALQVLVYPVTQYECSRKSYVDNGAGYFLTAADMSWFWHQYLPDPGLAADPDVSPLNDDDLAGLPPAIVLTAGFDPLHDQGVAYADRLATAGVGVDLKCYPGMIHGFMRNFSVLDAASAAVGDVGGAIRRLLDGQ